ncbi:MAG: glycerol kinase GlpK [Alphaproteobacteria bacterium]
MAAKPAILALDQGTTSTRAMLFDRDGAVLGIAQEELPQSFPREGWVEHDAERIWADTLSVGRRVLAQAHGLDVKAVGITNQRETTVVWDRASGRPIHPAIVWQDRRGAAACRALQDAGHEPLLRARTGLLADSYFSATKLQWLLDHVPGAREAAAAGRLAFGTIDSFLIWRLTGGRVHATDATNASRTLLFDIHRQGWDKDLLALFRVPAVILPKVLDNADDYGVTDPAHFGRAIPIRGVAGDQHAALFGQACFAPGMVKSTYGTGCFVLANVGETAPAPANGLITTLAYRLRGKPVYAVEGSSFNAGTAIKWLRDELRLIRSAGESETLARSLPESRGVYFVPAFTGLGAPHWDAEARGAIFGLGRDTSVAEIVRAGLESVCFQTRDLLDAMDAALDGTSGAPQARTVRVDGGMVANDWLMQSLADIIDRPVERPPNVETTALGAAWLAGLGVGLFSSLNEIGRTWRMERRFMPAMDASVRLNALRGWRNAVARVRDFGARRDQGPGGAPGISQ